MESPDRYVTERGVESICVDVGVCDCGSQAPERIDECERSVLEFVSRCVTDRVAECVVRVVIDKDGKALGVAGPNHVIERPTDIRVDEIASALAAPPEVAAVRRKLSVGDGPLWLEAGGATGDAAGHVGCSVGKAAEFLGAEGQATEYGSGKFVRGERREMLEGVRVAKGADDVDAGFADVELVGDCGVDEV